MAVQGVAVQDSVFGWSLQFTGDIAIKRGDRKSAQASMLRCRQYVKRHAGDFSEGTRSKPKSFAV